MKVRQSASLMAGVCTLCVAASGSVTPVASAAAKPLPASSPVVSRPYELTASQGLLIDSVNFASLPLQNFVTALSAVAGAAGGSGGLVNGSGAATSLQALPNLLYSQLVAGTLTSTSATTAINAALALEQTALTNLAATPQKIITTDVTALNNLLGDLGLGSIGTAAAATPFKAAAVSADAAPADAGGTAVNLANVLGIPLQNFVTVLNALAGAAGGGNGLGAGGATSLQALPNLLYSQLVAGTLTSTSATTAINAALATEQTALTNLANTPGAIINHDVAAITALFGGLGGATPFAASNSTITPAVNVAAVTTNATSADAGGTAVDFANVVSLPLQNFVTALSAIAGAAGGSGGLVNGSGAATSLQALPNLLYGQLVAGTLTQASATTAINAALATEQTALTNLAATPQKIVTTDVAAIKKLAGDFGAASTQASSLKTDTSVKQLSLTSGATKSGTTTPGTGIPNARATLNSITQGSSKIKADSAADPGTPGSNTQARHFKKTSDGPSANAGDQSDGSSKRSHYVGRHRAGSDGAKSSKGSK